METVYTDAMLAQMTTSELYVLVRNNEINTNQFRRARGLVPYPHKHKLRLQHGRRFAHELYSWVYFFKCEGCDKRLYCTVSGFWAGTIHAQR